MFAPSGGSSPVAPGVLKVRTRLRRDNEQQRSLRAIRAEICVELVRKGRWQRRQQSQTADHVSHIDRGVDSKLTIECGVGIQDNQAATAERGRQCAVVSLDVDADADAKRVDAGVTSNVHSEAPFR